MAPPYVVVLGSHLSVCLVLLWYQRTSLNSIDLGPRTRAYTRDISVSHNIRVTIVLARARVRASMVASYMKQIIIFAVLGLILCVGGQYIMTSTDPQAQAYAQGIHDKFPGVQTTYDDVITNAAPSKPKDSGVLPDSAFVEQDKAHY